MVSTLIHPLPPSTKALSRNHGYTGALWLASLKRWIEDDESANHPPKSSYGVEGKQTKLQQYSSMFSFLPLCPSSAPFFLGEISSTADSYELTFSSYHPFRKLSEDTDLAMVKCLKFLEQPRVPKQQNGKDMECCECYQRII